MKKYKLSLISLTIAVLLNSCGNDNSENSTDMNPTESDYVTDSEVSKDSEISITNGKYYFTDGNGYVEITEGKYFQLVDFDEDFIDKLVKTYAEMGSIKSLYFNEGFVEKNNLTVDIGEVKERAINSVQLKTEIVDQKAEFEINVIPEMVYYCDSDCELTYFLDEVGLWFPFIYFYNDEPKKLLNDEFGYEFVLKE